MKHQLLTVCLTILGLASCTKNTGHNPPGSSSAGFYLLSQGRAQLTSTGTILPVDSAFHSTLEFFDPATHTLTDRFSQVNGTSLGYVATDMGIYGSKLFVTTGYPQSVTVVDAATSRLITRTAIALPDSVHPNITYLTIPKHICFFNSSAYITLEDEVIAVMDTATLKITKYLNLYNFDPNDQPLGYNPFVAPVFAGGTLYVAGLSSICAVDPASGKVMNTIPVYYTPSSMTVNADKIYVQSAVDTCTHTVLTNDELYALHLVTGITVIASATNQVIARFPGSATSQSPLTATDGQKVYYTTGNTIDCSIAEFDAASPFSLLPSFAPNTPFSGVTALTADPLGNQLLVAQSTQPTAQLIVSSVDVFLDSQLQYSLPTKPWVVKMAFFHP